MNRGILLVLFTAFVSGVSIFVNASAVKGFNPFLLTTLKNTLVAFVLFSVLLIMENRSFREVFDRRLLPKFLVIGLIGGSIPFFLFFYALSLLQTPATAGFIHKTLFIWASIFAFVLLREKLTIKFLLAAFVLLLGNYLFFLPDASLGFPALLVLIATILWSVENVIAKSVLGEVSGTLVAFARMFFGSAFMLAALVAFMPNVLFSAFTLSLAQLAWLCITSCFLFLYVFTYYNGLKHIPVHKATSILLLAQPITALLSTTFTGVPLTLEKALGALLIVCGVILVVGISYAFSKFEGKVPLWVRSKAS